MSILILLGGICKKQFEAFDTLNFPVKHCCASNCMVLPTKYFKDMVRVGLAMYGYDYSLSPCMSVKAAISAVLSVKRANISAMAIF